MGAGSLIPGATRALSRSEKVQVLKNQVVFLQERIADLEGQIELLIDDNAEMDFLAGVNERARTAEIAALYDANVARIEAMRREIAATHEDIRIYRRVLA